MGARSCGVDRRVTLDYASPRFDRDQPPQSRTSDAHARSSSLVPVVAAPFLVVCSWVAASGAAPNVSAASCWGRLRTTPRTRRETTLFYSSASSISTSFWAVGYAGSSTLVEHWDGCTLEAPAERRLQCIHGHQFVAFPVSSRCRRPINGPSATTPIPSVVLLRLLEHGNGSMWSQLIVGAAPVHYLVSVDGGLVQECLGSRPDHYQRAASTHSSSS